MSRVDKISVDDFAEVVGNITTDGIFDRITAGTLTIASATATKVELSSTGVDTEIKGSLNALEGAVVTGNATVSGTVGVGSASAPPSDALIEFTSTNSGILLPRMTTAQRTSIGTPSDGLFLYDTDKSSVYLYNGTNWFPLTRTLIDDTNVLIGEGAGDAVAATHDSNVYIGKNAGNLNGADDNTVVGSGSLPIAVSNPRNTVVGANSAVLVTTGCDTTIMGALSGISISLGSNNTILGSNAGNAITTGGNNTMLGGQTNGGALLVNQTSLGFQAVADKSNQVMVGNSNLIEMVPNSGAIANLGTSTNPWNNINAKGDCDLIASGQYLINGLPFSASDLGDISVTSPVADQQLVYTGAQWENQITRKRIDLVNTTIETITNGVWTTLSWNVERLKDSTFTHIADSEEITVNSTDLYQITYHVVYTTGGNSKTYQCRVEKDTGGGYVAIQYSNIYGSSSGNEGNTIGSTFFESLTAGDKIRVTGQAISNSTTFFSKVGASHITITRI